MAISKVGSDGLATSAVGQSNMGTGVAGTGPAFSAYSTGGQSISSSVNTKITFNTEFFDTASCFDTTNYRFTPNVAGYYQISSFITTSLSSGVTQVALMKNGGQYAISCVSNTIQGVTPCISVVMYLNGTTDYVESYFYQSSGGAYTTLTSRSDCYQFTGALVRAA